jgi:hypothetical protein
MDHQDDDAVMCKRTYNKASGEWGPWETIFSRRRRPGKQDSFRFEFPKGGYVEVNTNSLPQHEQNLLAEELRNCPHFLQYYVQGSPEPRLHFLLNGDATETRSDPQPGYGYGYGQVRMKSLPLPIMKEVNKLADRLERKYRSLLRRNGVIVGEGCFWNIGVDCIIYRDGRDSMGDHADDSQGEELIVTVLVSSPVDSIRGRMVYIKPAGQTRSGNTKIIEDGDVEIMLFLKASDSYAMDGKNKSLRLEKAIHCAKGFEIISLSLTPSCRPHSL